MSTVDIVTANGSETVASRRCPVPGLTITGSRGGWAITHTASGKRLVTASLVNTNATLADIRNAAFLAQSFDLITGQPIDWTASEADLPGSSCIEWVRAFLRILS